MKIQVKQGSKTVATFTRIGFAWVQITKEGTGEKTYATETFFRKAAETGAVLDFRNDAVLLFKLPRGYKKGA